MVAAVVAVVVMLVVWEHLSRFTRETGVEVRRIGVENCRWVRENRFELKADINLGMSEGISSG